MSSGSAANPALISVDWGTTSLRCFLVAADGTVLDYTRAERGILKTGGQPFAAILHDLVGPWLKRCSSAKEVPVLMSGMIGSRQGWQEAPYLRCPASPVDLGQALMPVTDSLGALAACSIHIVPGIDTVKAGVPDVMRGEETQVLGALISAGVEVGMFVLPGTHSKWVAVKSRTIVDFQTFMTGETYAALLDHTILGGMCKAREHDSDAFEFGIATAHETCTRSIEAGELLHLVFSARTRVLHGQLEATGVASYLSGILIGAECLSGLDTGAATREDKAHPFTVFVLADEPLRDRYETAVASAGYQLEPQITNAVPTAHFEIAKLAGLMA